MCKFHFSPLANGFIVIVNKTQLRTRLPKLKQQTPLRQPLVLHEQFCVQDPVRIKIDLANRFFNLQSLILECTYFQRTTQKEERICMKGAVNSSVRYVAMIQSIYGCYLDFIKQIPCCEVCKIYNRIAASTIQSNFLKVHIF